jgi:hypothetical protein
VLASVCVRAVTVTVPRPPPPPPPPRSVSDVEQEKRFTGRIEDPAKRWKLSPFDLTARSKCVRAAAAGGRRGAAGGDALLRGVRSSRASSA